MAWNYRKRIKIAPGVNVNLSKGGISASVGPKGAKVTFGKGGTYLNKSIPGTGLYSREKISGSGTSKIGCAPLLAIFIIGIIYLISK